MTMSVMGYAFTPNALHGSSALWPLPGGMSATIARAMSHLVGPFLATSFSIVPFSDYSSIGAPSLVEGNGFSSFGGLLDSSGLTTYAL